MGVGQEWLLALKSSQRVLVVGPHRSEAKHRLGGSLYRQTYGPADLKPCKPSLGLSGSLNSLNTADHAS